MPSILSHPAVPLALAIGLGSRTISPRLLFAGVVASIIPDLDVLTFRLGIPYSNVMGHRGISHSLAFAIGPGLLATASCTWLKTSRSSAFIFVAISAASHGLLDMLTNGGSGIAFLWPMSDSRFFFPTQVIEVSPLSMSRFFGSAGTRVLGSELMWVWTPSIAICFAIYALRRRNAR